MNVVCLMGSPRKKGNSTQLANYLLTQLSTQGVEVRSFYLNDLQMRGCQACDACKRELESCVVQDGLTEVLDAVFAADALVFASPVYYGDISAQLKTFIDRSYSYLKPRYITLEHPSRFPERKPLVFILTQGHRDGRVFDDILPRYSQIFHWTGFAETKPVRVIDVYHPGDVEKKTEIFAQLDQIAAELLCDGAEKTQGDLCGG